jgi:hypothetical protein
MDGISMTLTQGEARRAAFGVPQGYGSDSRRGSGLESVTACSNDRLASQGEKPERP